MLAFHIFAPRKQEKRAAAQRRTLERQPFLIEIRLLCACVGGCAVTDDAAKDHKGGHSGAAQTAFLNAEGNIFGGLEIAKTLVDAFQLHIGLIKDAGYSLFQRVFYDQLSTPSNWLLYSFA